MLTTYRKNFFSTAFQNPENLNYIMSYMESERTKISFFQHFPNGYGQIYIYIVLVQFINVKTTIIVLSCLYQYVA